ncbi:unnamed protein product [Prunus brigantina]
MPRHRYQTDRPCPTVKPRQVSAIVNHPSRRNLQKNEPVFTDFSIARSLSFLHQIGRMSQFSLH